MRNAHVNTHGKLVAFPRHLVFNEYLLCTHSVFANALMVFKSEFLKNISLSFFIQRKKDVLESADIFVHKNVVKPEPKRRRRSKEPVASSSYLLPSAEKRPQAAEPAHDLEPLDMCKAEGIPAAEEIGEGASVNEACPSCVVLRNEKRKLSNTVRSLRKKLQEKRKELTKMEKKLEGNVIVYMENVLSHHVIFAGNTINGV